MEDLYQQSIVRLAFLIELLEIMFDGRTFHSLAVVGKKLLPNVLDTKKLAVMFT